MFNLKNGGSRDKCAKNGGVQMGDQQIGVHMFGKGHAILSTLPPLGCFWHLHFVLYTNIILASLSDKNSCYAMRSRLLNN